jgi:hypothetical protein
MKIEEHEYSDFSAARLDISSKKKSATWEVVF